MNEIKFYFTDAEMEEFLKKHGYQIETVQAWYESSAVENYGKDAYFDVKVATLEGIGKAGVQPWNRDMLLSSLGIKNVFTRVLQKKLLGL